MTQDHAITPAGPGEVVAQRVRKLRDRRGWSAQDLADACAEVGASDLDRARIANLETRRRRNVSVDELLTLAYVLDVAPLHLFLPLDDEAPVRVAPSVAVPAVQARAWVRGQEALPGGDEKTFHTEVPESEWEAPSEEERRALERLERARYRVRVADKKLALVAEHSELSPAEKIQAEVSGSLTGGAAKLQEQRLDRAWTDVAEAEVYLEEAEREYRAIRKRAARREES